MEYIKKDEPVFFADKGTFVERLNGLLWESHTSMAALSRNICSKGTIENYCNGKNMPTSETLQKICQFFNCSCDYLLGLSSVKELPPQWVPFDEDVICSRCHSKGNVFYRYCPSCGREMNK